MGVQDSVPRMEGKGNARFRREANLEVEESLWPIKISISSKIPFHRLPRSIIIVSYHWTLDLKRQNDDGRSGEGTKLTLLFAPQLSLLKERLIVDFTMSSTICDEARRITK